MSELTVINALQKACGLSPDPTLNGWFQRRMASKSRCLTCKEKKQLLVLLLQKIAKGDYELCGETPATVFFSHCYLIRVTVNGVQLDAKISDWQIDILANSESTHIASDVPSLLKFIAPIKKRIERLWQMIDQRARKPFPGTGPVKPPSDDVTSNVLQFPR